MNQQTDDKGTAEIDDTTRQSELIAALATRAFTTEQLIEMFNSTNDAEPLSGGWPGLERFAQKVEAAARADEMLACWEAINNRIKLGPLQGNGCDEQAQRNGMVIATNIIAERIMAGA